MQIVRASSPQQLLLALPHLAGSAIARSILVVPFHGSRTGMAVRCDIPVLPRGALAAWADDVVASVLDVGPDAVAVAVVTDRVVGAGALPHRALVRALVAACRRAHLPVRARLCQAADAWGDYAQPLAARGPIAELEVTPGLPFLPPTPAPRVPEPASPARRRAVADALETIADSGAMRAALDDPVVTVELALQAAVRDPERVATVLALVQHPAIRDATTCQLLDGIAAGIEAHALQRGEGSAAGADRLLGIGPAPDRDRVERGVGLLEDVVAAAPDGMRAAPLTMLASLHWLLGRSGTAAACVEAALRDDPDLGMALLMATVLHAGMLPEWVAADRAAVS
ncbi:DUF4192 family protein [Agrococcus sp. SGAir0287]|uniref:DUF4192 family protein n=1 Tax=Agrococcus sp. SGAir0287 TaxID=2070347 RepID=UPI0010F90117|nr:DUF4192 family protein [Agrococcus sp. SGAir0287]